MRKSLLVLLVAALLGLGLGLGLGLALALPTPAEDKKDQDGITKEQADAILKELQAIRQMLEQQRANPPRPPAPPPAPIELPLGEERVLGRDDAPLTMVEFTDYQCSYCRRFHQETFPEIKRRYIDTGQVRFISRDLPLNNLHPQAGGAARAARCAGEQGKFWEMRDLLIANNRNLAREAMAGYAQNLSLDVKAFETCFDSSKYDAAIDKDVAAAAALGIDATPTFILGLTAKQSLKGTKLVGAHPLVNFENRIRELLPQPAPAAR